MLTSPFSAVSALAQKRWIKRTLIGIGAFLLVFSLFAYFALPRIIKSQAETLALEKLHRQLSIERIDINPYALTLDIHGATLLEPDGKATFAAFDLLHLNLSLRSLFHFAPVVEDALLDKPYVHLVRTAANHYNVDDIVALIASLPPTPEPARFAAYNLQLAGGRIEFDDRPIGSKHAVSELALGVPFISSLPSQVDVFIEPLFSAKIDGSLLQLKGKARPFATPREAVVALDIDDADLTRYFDYLPFKPQFKLPAAKLDTHLTIAFRQPKEQPPSLSLKGNLALKSLLLTEADGKPMIELPRLTVTMEDLNPLSSKLAIAKIEVDHPQLDVRTNADGSLNLARLSPSPSTAHTAQTERAKVVSSPGLQITLGELAITGAGTRYGDAHGRLPLHAGVDKFDLKLSRLTLDLQQRTVGIGTVASSSADFMLVHDKVTLSKGDKAVTAAPAENKKTANKKAAADTAASSSYTVSVDKIAIDNWSAHLEDRTLPQPAITKVTAVTLDAQDFSNARGKTGKLDIKAQVNQKGRFAAAGNVGLAPLHADLALDLKTVDLMPLQPFFSGKVNLLLTRAALSTRAALKLDEAADGTLKGNFTGDLAVSDLASLDKISGSDFLRWKVLALSGVDVQLAPLAVTINQIALDDFFARIIVDANGHLNLQDIAREDGDEEKSLTETDSAAPARSAPATRSGTNPATSTPTRPSSPMPPLKIRKVVLKSGNVRFSDNFIKPNYSASLMDLGGTVSNLSSTTTSTAAVELRGKVNSAPLNIVGSVNPLSGNLFLDLRADVRGMELAPLSPYSGKYVGYDIEKGRLSFEVAYHLENRKLEAQNRLILDQLTFGKKIESPSATTLPVGFAIALLRDRNGVIDVNLPIGGSLDDPQFSIGGIILRVVANLITKAVTAPFALLGSLFGGGEELSWLDFEAGRDVVPAAAQTKLNSLARALNDRPALKLEITGRYDQQADRDGLARAGIERKVRALKLKQLANKGESADMASLTIKAEEYAVLLTKVYKNEDFSKPRNAIGLQKDLPVEEMEKLMMANSKVGDDDLVALGNQRAQAVKDWLIKNGQVPAERIFIVAAKNGDSGDKAKASRVDFSLR